MAFQGYQVNTFRWVLFSITTICVFIRLYVQFRLRANLWREGFVITAWLFYLGCTTCFSVLTHLGYWDPNVDKAAWTEDTRQEIFKIYTAFTNMYMSAVYLCKMVLLFLYLDLSPRHLGFNKTWWSIMVAWVLTIAGFIELIFYHLLKCVPFHLQWTGTYYDCKGNTFALSIVVWTFHLLTDVIVYIIPFIIIYNLRSLKKKDILSTFLLFGLGLLNIVTALMIFLVIVLPGDLAGKDMWDGLYGGSQFFTPLQQGTAVMIVCLPQVRRLWNEACGKNEKDNSHEVTPEQRPRKKKMATFPDLETGLDKHDASVTVAESHNVFDSTNMGSMTDIEQVTSEKKMPSLKGSI